MSTLHAADAPVSYKLVAVEGRLVIESSRGERLPWACYGVSSERELRGWIAKNEGMVKAGVTLLQIAVWPTAKSYWDQPFWSPDGQPLAEPRGPTAVGEQIEWALAQTPKARFMIRFGLHPDSHWRKDHLDEFPQLSKRSGYPDTRAAQPSLASELYVAGVERLIRDTIAWCERQPWRDTVIGYTLFPYGEGCTELGFNGELFDTSAPMQARFRAFLRARYGTDAALQAAWQDQAVTLANAAVPTRDDWQAKRRRLGLRHWPDPAQVQRERDYFLLQKEVYHQFWTRVLNAMQEATAARPVIKAADSFKQHLQGWIHNGDFDALWQPDTFDTYGQPLLASGAIGCAPLLDHPGLDMLQTPGMYYNRAMGYAWEAEGLTDAMRLRGKLNFMEADLRTWVDKDWHGNPRPPGSLINDAGTFLNQREMVAGFDRTLAWAWSRNQMFYLMSVCGGNWWFDDPAIYAKLGTQAKLIADSLRAPWRELPGVVCLVVDDEASFDEDFSAGFQHQAVYRQLEEGLALCGVPYRIHLFADLARDNFPDYQCYLFPNLFRLTPEREAVLRRRVLRGGHLAIFGPGTGVTDGAKLSADGASRLLGVRMELLPKTVPRRVMLQDHGHPLSRQLPTMTFGSAYAYGPLLVPAVQRLDPPRDGAWQLGAGFYQYFLDRPGPFIKEFGRGAAGNGLAGPRGDGDYAVVFSPTAPLPPEFLRACARYAGCHVWSDENAVIYAADGFLALHTAKGGRHTLRLPASAVVRDLVSGQEVPTDGTRLELDLVAPATRLFSLTPR